MRFASTAPRSWWLPSDTAALATVVHQKQDNMSISSRRSSPPSRDGQARALREALELRGDRVSLAPAVTVEDLGDAEAAIQDLAAAGTLDELEAAVLVARVLRGEGRRTIAARLGRTEADVRRALRSGSGKLAALLDACAPPIPLAAREGAARFSAAGARRPVK